MMEKSYLPSRKYYLWIDYAKFISIFFVVSYHIPFTIDGYWGAVLTNFRMPLFFFVSGFLFNPSKYSSFILFFKHRAKQLLIPYFSFFFIFYPLWIFIGKNTGNEADINASYIQPLIDCIYGRPQLVCAPLWFISCLFLVQCIYYFISLIKNRLFLALVLILLSFISIFIVDLYLPWMLGHACKFIIFYGVASCFNKEIQAFLSKKYSNILAVLFLFAYLVGVYFKWNMESEYMINFLFVFCGFLVILALISFSKLLAQLLGESKLVQYITTNAIIILALQNYVIGVFKILFFNVLNINEFFYKGRYDINIIFTFITLSVMLIFIYIIDKYFPFIVGRGKYFNTNKI